VKASDPGFAFASSRSRSSAPIGMPPCCRRTASCSCR